MKLGHITKVTVVQLLAFAGFVVFGLVICSLWNDEQERRFKEYERAQQEGRERAAARRAAKLAYRAKLTNSTTNNFYATNNARTLTAKEREFTERARELLWGTNLTNVSKP